MTKKTIMVIGAGFEQVPLIKAAKRLDLYTLCVDRNPESPGFQYCDMKGNIDIVDVGSCLDLAEKYNIAGVVTSTESGLETVGYICDRFRLHGNGLDTIRSIKNKLIQMQILEKNNIYVPKTRRIYRPKDIKNVTFPSVIKPSDSAGARGVYLVKSPDDMKKRFCDAIKYTLKDYVLLQEYIKGKEIGAEVVVQDSQIKGIYLTEKNSTNPPCFVVMGHKMPAILSREIINEIHIAIGKVIKVFHIKDSMVNFDLKLKDGKYPCILELGPRLGGNWLPYLVRLAGGGDNYENAIKIALEIPVDCRPCRRFSAIRYFGTTKGGVLREISYNVNEINELVDRIRIFKNKGKDIVQTQKHSDRIGYFIVSAETKENLERKIQEVQKNVVFSIN